MSEDTPTTSSKSQLPLDAPSKMSSETLAGFVGRLAGHIAEQLEGLEPYYRELRESFHHLRRGERIVGCNSWSEYCDHVLHRTKRAINYWLAGGNPASKRLPASADDERETVSHVNENTALD